jgi:hypothetical protein
VAQTNGPHQTQGVVHEYPVGHRHEPLLPQVCLPTKRIDQADCTWETGGGSALSRAHRNGHRVDGEVALGQIIQYAGPSKARHIDMALRTHHPIRPMTPGEREPGGLQPAGDLTRDGRRVIGYNQVQVGRSASRFPVAHRPAHQPTLGLAAPQDVGHCLQHHLVPHRPVPLRFAPQKSRRQARYFDEPFSLRRRR